MGHVEVLGLTIYITFGFVLGAFGEYLGKQVFVLDLILT